MLVIQTKRNNEKISEIENKITTDHNHDKHITTQKFNKLTTENFTARLKQPKLASKINISNFLKETDFDSKLKNVTSNENKLNELSKKVKSISTKGLTKDLINKISILNRAKYFSLYFKIIQYIYQLKNTSNILVALLELNCRNLMECQKKILKL